MAKKWETPNFYAIIPAPIRYADNLSELQKLLYGEITALSNKEGYCFASNSYFANLYGKTPKWISAIITDMKQKWYLEVKSEKEWGRSRRIFVGEITQVRKSIKTIQPIPEKKDTPIPLKQERAIPEKKDTLSQKNRNIILQDNTTSVNREETSSTHKNVDFINWMRDVEVRWANWLTQWNTLTSRSDLMNSWIKKELLWIMKNTSLEVFLSRVNKFREILQIIEQKKLYQMMYYPIWERDFEAFIKGINKFYGENTLIFWRLCHLQLKAKVIRAVSKKSEDTIASKAQGEEQTTKEEKKPLTEEEKKERLARLRAIQDEILSK